jgi:ribosomal protein S18 acetylase RimI-like enzyme
VLDAGVRPVDADAGMPTLAVMASLEDGGVSRGHATPGIVVRPAREGELDAAGEVVRAAYEADGLAPGPEYLALLADARARAADAVVAVALDDGGLDDGRLDADPASSARPRVIGSVTFTLPGSRWAQLAQPGQAEFRMLGVQPDARGRGVGLALVQWCLDQARASGAREVVLCSATTMRAAHRLYATLGFTRRPALDWSPMPGLDLLGFGVVLNAPSATGGR